MTSPRASRLAWAAPVAVVMTGAVFLMIVPAEQAEDVDVLFSATFLAYAVVGAMIVSRHPRHPIGRLFCATAVVSSAANLLYGYGHRTEDPGAAWAAWLAGWTVEPTTMALVLLLLLFPTGRFLSRRWRLVGRAAVATSALWAVGLALDPGPLRDFETTVNPVGVEAAGPVLAVIADLGVLALLCFVVAGGVGAIARYRAARGDEREQTKWLALGAGATLAMVGSAVALVLAVDTDRGGWDLLAGLLICLGLACFPVAAGVAILRHRLYDIDVVINRALVYGGLSALLAAVYLGLVLLIGLAAGGSGLDVAASTLAVAALFRPARTRVQAAVDRRFYRRRYDAAQTLAGFGGRLRDQVDLEALGGELRGVVRETVQPAHVSLWLRGMP